MLKASLLLLAVILAGAVPLSTKPQKSANEILLHKMRKAMDHGHRHKYIMIPNFYDFGQDLLKRSLLNTERCAGANKDQLEKIMEVRGSRMEAAYGVATQGNSEGIKAVLRETLKRCLCIAKIAFNDAPTVLENLFALPRVGPVADREASFDREAFLASVSENERAFYLTSNKQWFNIDVGRMGQFMTTNLAVNKATVDSMLDGTDATTNIRELMHLFARMSQYGEDILDVANNARGSFRDAVYRVGADTTLSTRAAADCGFNEAKYTRMTSFLAPFPEHTQETVATSTTLTKNLINPENTSVIWQARLKQDGRVFRHSRTPVSRSQTYLTKKIYADLNIPAPSTRENAFMMNYAQYFYDGERQSPFPFNSGGNFFNFLKPDGTFDTTKWTVDWITSMAGDGLDIDCGPSGTTDELLTFGDWVGVTGNDYGYCMMLDSAIAGMVLYEHHSLAEVLQGADNGVRNVNPSLKWRFANPLSALDACDATQPNLTSKFRITMPPTINRKAAALPIFTRLSDPDDPMSLALASSDWGRALLTHKFSVSDEPAAAGATAQYLSCICNQDNRAINSELAFLCPG